MERAVFYSQQPLQLDPYHIDALSDMADLMLIKGNPKEALGYARTALSASPRAPRPYLIIGNILLAAGQISESEKYYRRVLSLGAPWFVVTFNQANAYLFKGDRPAAKSLFAELLKATDTPAPLKEQVRQILSRL